MSTVFFLLLLEMRCRAVEQILLTHYDPAIARVFVEKVIKSAGEDAVQERADQMSAPVGFAAAGISEAHHGKRPICSDKYAAVCADS